jgi:hypothetical protein
MALDEVAVKDVALQAAVLVLIFGYGDGAAAVEEALTTAGHEPTPVDVQTTCAYLASTAGQAAVAAYVAATLRDFGPVGGAISDFSTRMRERFPA